MKVVGETLKQKEECDTYTQLSRALVCLPDT